MAQAFPDVPKIEYGGPKSKNPLEFKHYNPDEIVDGKSLKDHLRFSVVYWHTFCHFLSDPFGVGTAIRPWDDGVSGMDRAKARVKVAFEFFEKLGVPFYAFHDRDVAPHQLGDFPGDGQPEPRARDQGPVPGILQRQVLDCWRGRARIWRRDQSILGAGRYDTGDRGGAGHAQDEAKRSRHEPSSS